MIKKAADQDTINELLLREEYVAERIIGILRVIFYALIMTEMFVVSSVTAGKHFGGLVWPFIAMFLLAVLLLADVLIYGRPAIYRFFTRYSKYVVITIDVVSSTALIYFIFAYTELKDASTWGLPTVSMMMATLLLVISVFRYSAISCFYTGALCMISNAFLLMNVNGYSSFDDFFYVKNDYNYAMGYYVWTVIPMTMLTGLLSHRIRKILTRTKRQQQLERFLPEVVAQEILAGDRDLTPGGLRQNVTILFSDIRNFTRLSESIPPEDVIDFLNIYFNDMIEIIFKHNGVLDKIVGDGIMAVFGVTTGARAAENAVHTAVDMHRKLEGFNSLRKMQNLAPVKIGVGIHTGEVIMGNVGSEKRMDFTAIGDAVNTAARLEGLTKRYKAPILISDATRKHLNGEFPMSKLGDVKVKGRKNNLKIYSVTV